MYKHNPIFIDYQITKRTTERFNQLQILMNSNNNMRIRIPGFLLKNNIKYETYNGIETQVDEIEKKNY